jgi:hypothetical protein
VRRKNGVDESRLSEAGLSCAENINIASGAASKLKELGKLNSPTQMTLNWKPRFNSFFSICDVMLSKPTWLRGYTECSRVFLSAVVAIATKVFDEK